MIKGLVFLGFLFMSLRFQSVDTSINEADLENVENLKLLENISENNKNENRNLNLELKNFFNDDQIICQNSIIRYEKLMKTTENYIQRYINLFLITSNLLNYKIKDSNMMITVDLDISISGEDLSYLQNYEKNSKDSSYLRKFSKLDAIFSKIAKLKERSFMESAVKSSKSFFESLNIISAINTSGFYHFFPFLIIFFVSGTIHNFIFHKSLYVFLGIFMNTLMFWESLQIYWKKIKEADLEIYVKTLQSKGIPEDCDPANSRWYHSLLNLFSENQCLQYYKNINKIPVEEVSLLKCIIDTYTFYLIRTPLQIFGASIRDLTGEISDLWPWPFKYLLNIPIAFFFGVLIFAVILILCGKRLRFSFLGAGIEVGDVKVITKKENFAMINYETSKPNRNIRKLKPWTKSRFPKRLELDLERRRKLYFKPSKSIPFVNKGNNLNFSHSDSSLNDSTINHD